MQSFKEYQGEIRKTSSVIYAKKWMKTIGGERLEISSRKTRDTKGTFHAKTGTIKERNVMDLTKTEDTKKRWQKYKNYTKKILMTQITIMV